MTYVVKTYSCRVNKHQARQINETLKGIDRDATFIRHYEAGNDIHGWIERTNDGTNEQGWRRERNRRLVAATDLILLVG
jgi:hypothetical protein